MSTSSPVTLRTTSGPVTKIRPSGPMITMSVSAGPYAAPPAAGPSTRESCGILPLASVIAAKTRPTPCSESTPSVSRAPPLCQMPTTGKPRSTATLVGRESASQPACPWPRPAGGVGGERDHRDAVGGERGDDDPVPSFSTSVIVAEALDAHHRVTGV